MLGPDVPHNRSEFLSGTSIVIPAWNDAERLRPTLEALLLGLDRKGVPYEIIVVADGCVDDTPGMVGSFGRENVRVLEFQTRLGKGGAIIEGLMHARHEKVGFLDADAPLSVEDLLVILQRLDQFDGAIASRWAPGCKPRFHESPIRNSLSVGWSLLIRSLGLTKVRDTQCGAKFFRTAKLRQIAEQIAVRGWAFDVDLVYHWESAQFTLEEVATTWRDSPGSKLTVGRAVPIMFCTLVGIRVINSLIGRATPPRLRAKLHASVAELAGAFMTSGAASLTNTPTDSIALSQ